MVSIKLSEESSIFGKISALTLIRFEGRESLPKQFTSVGLMDTLSGYKKVYLAAYKKQGESPDCISNTLININLISPEKREVIFLPLF